MQIEHNTVSLNLNVFKGVPTNFTEQISGAISNYL
jgi:hypothetical protein